MYRLFVQQVCRQWAIIITRSCLSAPRSVEIYCITGPKQQLQNWPWGLEVKEWVWHMLWLWWMRGLGQPVDMTAQVRVKCWMKITNTIQLCIMQTILALHRQLWSSERWDKWGPQQTCCSRGEMWSWRQSQRWAAVHQAHRQTHDTLLNHLHSSTTTNYITHHRKLRRWKR